MATGLALTLFGLGLASLIGQTYSGISLDAFPVFDVYLLTEIPIIGSLLFNFDYLIYLSIIIVVSVYYFFKQDQTWPCTYCNWR